MVSKKHVKKIPVVGVRTERVVCMIFPLTRIATNILKGVDIFLAKVDEMKIIIWKETATLKSEYQKKVIQYSL